MEPHNKKWKRSELMKKIIIILMAMLLLTGCGSKEDKKPDNSNNTDKVTDDDSKDKDKEDKDDTKTASGFAFVQKGVKIPVNVDAAPIVEALGEPSSYFEAESCAFKGLDKTYNYNSIVIETYPKDGKDYISAVTVMDDSVETPEGVYIGSTPEDVKKAYGSDYKEVLSSYQYTKEDSTLTFVIEDGSVASITYLAVVPEL